MKKYKVCRNRGRPIKYIRTPAGNFMPCDTGIVYYWPDENGPDKIVTGDGYILCCRIAEKPHPDARIGLVPHWATCPHARKVSRAEKPSEPEEKERCEFEQLVLQGAIGRE